MPISTSPEAKKYVEAGVPRSTQIAVKTIDGVRVVTFTYRDAERGQPQFYEKKETLGLDLRHPCFSAPSSPADERREDRFPKKIVFESITPKTFDDCGL